METPYEQATRETQQRGELVSNLVAQVESFDLASDLVRALESKFGFWCILTSTADLQEYMDDYLGVEWFIERGYTNPDGSELEEVPRISAEQIEELALDMHPWREIEEDVWPRIHDGLGDTIDSMFPKK